MPHKGSFLVAMWQQLPRHVEDIFITGIIVFAELGRLLYFGGQIRKAAGEMIIRLILVHVVRPHIPDIPPLGDIHITSYDIAFVIGMLGVRGIRRLMEIAIRRQTGANLKLD